MTTTIIGVVAALAVLLLTVELLRRRALREKYAVIWLVVSLLAVVFTVFPGLLTRVSQRLGFQIPANFVFAIAALVLLVVGMQLSLEVGRLEDRSQRLAEEVGLLRLDIEQLRGQLAPPATAGESTQGLTLPDSVPSDEHDEGGRGSG